MKLEVGKSYKDGRGRVVTITERRADAFQYPYLGDDGCSYTEGGVFDNDDANCKYNLVSIVENSTPIMDESGSQVGEAPAPTIEDPGHAHPVDPAIGGAEPAAEIPAESKASEEAPAASVEEQLAEQVSQISAQLTKAMGDAKRRALVDRVLSRMVLPCVTTITNTEVFGEHVARAVFEIADAIEAKLQKEDA